MARTDDIERLIAEVKAVDSLWNGSVAMTIALSQVRPVSYGDKYLAILWGIVDSLGQVMRVSQEVRIRALLHYLKPYRDGRAMSVRTLRLVNNPQYAEWIKLSEQTVSQFKNSNDVDASTSFMKLAGKYVDSGGG